jgi:ATP-dependent DNA helicase RecQ
LNPDKPDKHPVEILKQYFGYPAFRPLQEEIIQSILAGKDTLALLPTGGGKSVCFQVPALCMPGICLVITPLIALMKDQVMQLRRRNISALAIHSGMAFFEVKKALENATTGHFKFLFVSPERLQTRLFLEYLPGMPINLLAVDEAHCISQWGYDFRPPYLRIAELREELDKVPVLALTASATPEVAQDICAKLGMEKPAVFTQSFARPNISFSAFETPHKLNKLLDILNNVPGSALVYCRNRKLTKEIAGWLSMHGVSASFYHAGLSSEDRTIRQEEWIRSKTRVMACTNAFGMGIDKPDVRVVVHIGPPDNLEDYYQEAGRAGRDGKKSYAVLLYTQGAITDLEEGVHKKYPAISEIREVYQAVANFLQLPTGSGEGQYFDFDLALFCGRFKQNPVTTTNALQTLASEGYISFNESVFIPSRLGFKCSKDYIYQFEKEQPLLEPLIKALLRTYEGIFDNEVNISERALARQLRLEVAEVVSQLSSLSFYQLVQYMPKKDSPQVFFPYNRIPADQLSINQKAYDERRQRHLHRVKAMISYASGQSCRSQAMQHYFGEKEAAECGTCDFCLAKKRKLSVEHTQLLDWLDQSGKILENNPLSEDELRHKLGLTRLQAEKLVSFGLSEEVFTYNDHAKLMLTGKI